jgi:hypothetical protein
VTRHRMWTTIPRDDAISFPAFLRGVGEAMSAKFPLCTRVLFVCANIVCYWCPDSVLANFRQVFVITRDL